MKIKNRLYSREVVLAESNETNLRNLRLDSRINPRQNIILDISIKDTAPKTTKNKLISKLNEPPKVRIDSNSSIWQIEFRWTNKNQKSLFPQISNSKDFQTPLRVNTNKHTSQLGLKDRTFNDKRIAKESMPTLK